MKIAYAMINVNRRDGSARAVIEVAERLARKHEVHLFARTVEDADLSNMTWHKMPGPGWPDFLDFATYHYLADYKIRSGDFDIIHSCGNNALEANVITIQNIQPAKRAFMKRALSKEKTSLARKVAKWLFLEITTHVEKRVYLAKKRPRALFLPVSQGVKEELTAYYKVPEASIKIIPNAADLNVFNPFTEDQKAHWRKDNGLPISAPLMVFVGGEWYRKGLDLAIQALGRMKNTQTHLLVAGQDADQPAFEKMALENGVAERVHFLGFRKDVADIMAASNLFLFPSWYEAFSLASIEAAACGLPIFAAKINGTEDFIQPGKTGDFLEHDPEAIAKIIDTSLNSPEALKRMGQEARELVENSYTWDRIAEMTEKAYMECLN